MPIQVELSRIIINETSDQQIIVLKEKGGKRSFPIVIGIYEILAIDRRLKKILTPRPLTHDLFESTIKQLDIKLEKILINDLHEHTFFAKIYLNHSGQMIELDSRPSDAITLATGAGAPIFVAEHVFEKACEE